jgi:hypothetical protein
MSFRIAVCLSAAVSVAACAKSPDSAPTTCGQAVWIAREGVAKERIRLAAKPWRSWRKRGAGPSALRDDDWFGACVLAFPAQRKDGQPGLLPRGGRAWQNGRTLAAWNRVEISIP